MLKFKIKQQKNGRLILSLWAKNVQNALKLSFTFNTDNQTFSLMEKKV